MGDVKCEQPHTTPGTVLAIFCFGAMFGVAVCGMLLAIAGPDCPQEVRAIRTRLDFLEQRIINRPITVEELRRDLDAGLLQKAEPSK